MKTEALDDPLGPELQSDDVTDAPRRYKLGLYLQTTGRKPIDHWRLHVRFFREHGQAPLREPIVQRGRKPI